MKNIVITGAGTGLGRTLARRFSAAGYRVFLLGRTLEKLEKVASELEDSAVALSCDIGCPESVKTAFSGIRAQGGERIDILVNNAAIYEPCLVRDATDSQIAAAAQTNYAGPIYCSRAAIPMMERGGQIINISSETVILPHAMFSLYQSSKAGLERFSEALRAELAPGGIRVTMVRAGQMMDEDSKSPSADMDTLRRFAEENLKRGLDLRNRPVGSFSSVADFIHALTCLPPDLHVPAVSLEAWRQG